MICDLHRNFFFFLTLCWLYFSVNLSKFWLQQITWSVLIVYNWLIKTFYPLTKPLHIESNPFFTCEYTTYYLMLFTCGIILPTVHMGLYFLYADFLACIQQWKAMEDKLVGSNRSEKQIHSILYICTNIWIISAFTFDRFRLYDATCSIIYRICVFLRYDFKCRFCWFWEVYILYCVSSTFTLRPHTPSQVFHRTYINQVQWSNEQESEGDVSL